MRYSSTLFIAMCLLSCQKKAAVQVSGLVKNIDGVIVRITDIRMRKTVYDSAIVKEGRFSFNTILPEEGFYNIDFEDNQYYGRAGGWQYDCIIYFENNKKYTFASDGRDDILNNYYQIFSSSKTQQELALFQNIRNKRREILKSRNTFFLHQADIYLNSGDDKLYRAALDSVRHIDDETKNINRNAIDEFITQHPNSILTPYLICQMDDFFDRYIFYKKIIDRLPEEVKKTSYAKRADARLKSIQKLHAGGKTPEIYGNDTQGQPFKYNFATRKYVLISFWASWCMSCRMQTPRLKELYNKYHQKGFDIISISLDERRDWWLRISKRDSIPWYNVCETVPVKKSKNVENFKANYLPYNYLVNGRKEIISREIELDSLERILQTL